MLKNAIHIAHTFGFNGQEKDDEITSASPSGSHLDFGARIYDSRIGRFLSLDPYTSKFPSETPYMFAGDNPIYFIDENGEFKISAKTKQWLFDNGHEDIYYFLVQTDPNKSGILRVGQSLRLINALIKNSAHNNLDKIPEKKNDYGGNDFSDEKYHLTPEIISEAFSPEYGPYIEFSPAPGGDPKANGHNIDDDGTDYTTPLVINERFLNQYKAAKKNGKRILMLVALIRLTAAIIHEYEEDFSVDSFKELDPRGCSQAPIDAFDGFDVFGVDDNDIDGANGVKALIKANTKKPDKSVPFFDAQ